MLEKVKTAYTNYRWLRFAACAGLLACASLLYGLSSGFPPHVWLFLFQVVPRVPHLWQEQGTAVLLPLVSLICLSLTLLLLWVAIVAAFVSMARYWWHDWQERQHFERALQEAEQLADQMVANEMQHMAAATGTAAQHSYSPVRMPQAVGITSNGNSTAAPSWSGGAAEPWMRAAQVVTPEPVAAQSVERQVQPIAAGAAGVATQYSSPALARGQLRLLPRTDQMDGETSDEEDEIPEIELPPQGEASGFEVGVGLHPGFHRRDAPNEDALFEIRGTHTTPLGLQQVGLFVVAGGMANSGPGHEASRLAIQALTAVMVPALLSNTKIVFADLLTAGVQSANLAVFSRNRELAGMNCKVGTTMTAALVVGPTAYIANVGNSRGYLYQQGKVLARVTRDHVLAAEFLQGASNTAHRMPAQAHSAVLERYLGAHASVEADVFTVGLRTGTLLLLCSDGLWTMVSDNEIASILSSPVAHPAQLSTTLVQTALNHGGADNISTVVIRYAGGQE